MVRPPTKTKRQKVGPVRLDHCRLGDERHDQNRAGRVDSPIISTSNAAHSRRSSLCSTGAGCACNAQHERDEGGTGRDGRGDEYSS